MNTCRVQLKCAMYVHDDFLPMNLVPTTGSSRQALFCYDQVAHIPETSLVSGVLLIKEAVSFVASLFDAY
ncbi:hypothetical protein P7K49_012552 [Saguinus oedipus]|uniref:Uncharacterized protein n=1 Tax=Saguinus oedipus TaxID=9490 RepID=A0ABQ9VTV4_SAGOE|nr:hypothetical protein P7K49_012552 [Saguinus oedipus]